MHMQTETETSKH